MGRCPEWRQSLGREVVPSPPLLTRHVKHKKRHELHYLKEVRLVAAQEECGTCLLEGSQYNGKEVYVTCSNEPAGHPVGA